MSYIQVEIGGKMRNLRYGNATDIEIKEKMAGVKNHIILGYIVIWAGLYIAAIVDDSPVDFTFKDVCDWAEKMKAEDVLKITECYKSTINFPIDKKKVQIKKSRSKTTKRTVLK